MTIVAGDGRLALERKLAESQPQRFDLLAMDALPRRESAGTAGFRVDSPQSQPDDFRASDHPRGGPASVGRSGGAVHRSVWQFVSGVEVRRSEERGMRTGDWFTVGPRSTWRGGSGGLSWALVVLERGSLCRFGGRETQPGAWMVPERVDQPTPHKAPGDWRTPKTWRSEHEPKHSHARSSGL
jgi:hypothetical protein